MFKSTDGKDYRDIGDAVKDDLYYMKQVCTFYGFLFITYMCYGCSSYKGDSLVGWACKQVVSVFLKRKQHLCRGPVMPLRILQLIIVSMQAIISVFVGPSVACIVWLLQFQMSQYVPHTVFIKEQTHLWIVILAPGYFRQRLWMISQ